LKCRATQECLLWLDAQPPAQVSPDFCPNLDLFNSCGGREFSRRSG
jgi:hypothetical protein